MEIKALVIYHKVDYDGIFSASIAKDYLEEGGFTVDLLGYNYNDEVPDITNIINDYENVSIVDITLPKEQMLELKKATDFIEVHWIDHHITAIQDSINFGYDDLPGLRDENFAACELCWEYFNRSLSIPRSISLAGRYDVWDKERGNWDSEILPFQFSLRTEYGVSCKSISKDWKELLSSDSKIDSLIEEGKIVLKYLTKSWRSAAKVCSFPVTVGGTYSGIAIISTELSSNSLSSLSGEYDIQVVVRVTGTGLINISMYSEKFITNLGEYMKEHYSGGGHANAAGGKLTLEEFINLITNHTI